MRFFCTWMVMVAMGLVLISTASAHEGDPYFADDQLRLAETYLKGGHPTSAIAPLLNILRSRDFRDTDVGRQARWRLAVAYLHTGLHGSAERLLEGLIAEAAPERSLALRELTRLHLRRDVEKGLETLEYYRTSVSGPTDHELILHAARRAFAAGQTESADRLFQILRDSPHTMDADYFLAVSLVLNGQLSQAERRFLSIVEESDRSDNPDVYDRALLALARMQQERGGHAEAIEWYAEVAADSRQFDHALYEAAWSYLGLGDIRAARASLLSLALDRPLSKLQPRARLLFGYLLLESDQFMAAQQRFSGYISHYGAVSERITQLESHADEAAVYHMLLDNMTDTLTDGSRQDLELLSWLRDTPGVKRAHDTVTVLRGVERELSDTVRTLRDVQKLSEESYGDSERVRSMLRRATALRRTVQELRGYLGPEIDRHGQRLVGDADVTYQNIRRQLHIIHSAQDDLRRLEDKNQEKRQELINLLQYAEADRFTELMESSDHQKSTTTGSPGRRVSALFDQIDESDQRLYEAWREMARMELQAWEAAIQTLRIRYPDERIAHLSEGVQRLRRASTEDSELKIQLEQRRRATASAARPLIAAQMEHLQHLRSSLQTLVRQAETARGVLTVAEARHIREEIAGMLADAKLGSVDVAWRARESALSIGSEVAARESRELHSLEEFYASMQSALHQGNSIREEEELRDEALGERVKAVAAVLDRHLQVYRQQRESSEGLKRQLQRDLERDTSVASADTATLSLESVKQLEDRGLKLSAQKYFMNGRPLRHATAQERLRFLQPGGHQVDVVLTYRNQAGREYVFRGSFYTSLKPGENYLLTIGPDDGREPRLRFALAGEGGAP